jgi:hypothetical protein
MKYYLLTRSLKRKDVGIAFGQTKEYFDFEAKEGIPRIKELETLPNYHGKLTNDEFPEFKPRIKFELAEKGKLSDLVGIPNMNAKGMLVSSKFKKLLEMFKLQEHRFYTGQLKVGEFFLEYFWFHPLSEKMDKFIDFAKSIFEDSNEKRIIINSLNDKLGYYEKFGMSFYMKKVILKQPLDLFYLQNFQYGDDFFISESLANVLKKEKITGIEIKEQDIVFVEEWKKV